MTVTRAQAGSESERRRQSVNHLPLALAGALGLRDDPRGRVWVQAVGAHDAGGRWIAARAVGGTHDHTAGEPSPIIAAHPHLRPVDQIAERRGEVIRPCVGREVDVRSHRSPPADAGGRVDVVASGEADDRHGSHLLAVRAAISADPGQGHPRKIHTRSALLTAHSAERGRGGGLATSDHAHADAAGVHVRLAISGHEVGGTVGYGVGRGAHGSVSCPVVRRTRAVMAASYSNVIQKQEESSIACLHSKLQWFFNFIITH